MERRWAGANGGGPMPSGMGERVRRAERWLALLERDGVASQSRPSDLASRTLEAVETHAQREEQRRRFAQQIDMLSAGSSGSALGIRQLAALAAILLVGMSLLMPTLQHQRFEAERLACMSNLGQVAQAFFGYASDYDGVMPTRVDAVAAGEAWRDLMLGRLQPRADRQRSTAFSSASARLAASVPSNSTNLHLLIERGYATAAQLACPANESASYRHREGQTDWADPAQVSYSYQHQRPGRAMGFGHSAGQAILADRTPLVALRIERGTRTAEINFALPDTAASRLHNDRGQNITRADGSVTWTVMPTIEMSDGLDPDNIWLPRASDTADTLGSAPPIQFADSFLVP